MSELSDRLKKHNRDVAARDPELARELDDARRKAVAAPRAGARTRADVAEGVMMPPADRGDLAVETIVRRKARPVLAIKRGTTDLIFTEDDAPIWKKRLTNAKKLLNAAIPAVGRVEVKFHPTFEWIGTAWLVAEDIVVTNRHVAREFARRKGDEFVFLQGLLGAPMEGSIDFLEELDSTASLEFAFDRVLYIEEEGGPDMALIRVRAGGARRLAAPIALATAAPTDQEQVAVIGYPAQDSRIPEPDLMTEIFGNHYNKKRLAPGQIMGIKADAILHDCSTLGGNSGSVVLSLDSGKALGLHFAGRFLESNFAVPAVAIAERLDQFKRGRSPRRSREEQTPAPSPIATATAQVAMPGPAGDGAVTVTIPLRVTVQLGTAASGGAPRRRLAQPTAQDDTSEDVEEVLEEGRAEDYAGRDGYESGFLEDGTNVPLPKVTQGESDVLTYRLGGKEHDVLPYEHFSVLMSESRRMCRYSAVNIDGKLSRKMKRSAWRTDPRIPREAQIIKGECYGNAPKFARGHMTRREDPIWGTVKFATLGNADSMHVTNTVPQMQPFNAGIWLGLENYALENAREDDMRIIVFTGPFLREDDPEMFGVKIPVDFWKVIAFIHDDTGKLCATGYRMSQKDFLSEEEFVFGQHKTTQVPIASIETQAGLSFGRLTALDPLKDVEEALPAELTRFEQIKFVRA